MTIATGKVSVQHSLSSLSVLAIAVFATALLPCVTSAAVIDAVWNVDGDGNWNRPNNWSPSGVPDNTLGNQYNVRIDNDTNFNVVVALNVNLDINNLTVDAGDELS
jgi:hypothetical protein